MIGVPQNGDPAATERSSVRCSTVARKRDVGGVAIPTLEKRPRRVQPTTDFVAVEQREFQLTPTETLCTMYLVH
jgi:hypothetical protein